MSPVVSERGVTHRPVPRSGQPCPRSEVMMDALDSVSRDSRTSGRFFQRLSLQEQGFCPHGARLLSCTPSDDTRSLPLTLPPHRDRGYLLVWYSFPEEPAGPSTRRGTNPLGFCVSSLSFLWKCDTLVYG